MSKNAVVATLFAVLALFFVYDFTFVEPDVSAEYSFDDQFPSVSGQVTLQNVRHDTATRGRLLADLTVDVRSVNDVQFTGDAAFAVRRTGSTIPWRLTLTDECVRVSDGVLSDSRTAYKAIIQFRCKDIELATQIKSNELWYPFDGYSADLQFFGCVNKREACDLKGTAPGLPIRFIHVRAEPNDPQQTHLIATLSGSTDQGVRIQLKRRYFLRMVSIILFLMMLVFITYLVRSADPKETMTKSLGVFGGLWVLRSLIVPASVSAFPTLVDYVILTMFCAVFGLVLVRASER